MAVETNKSTIKVNGAVPNVAANAAATGSSPDLRRRRSSSLMKVANALPTVEHSLEEFIAKANQTLVDVEGWNSAEQAAKVEDVARKEQDAQRWKQAEVQMREGDAREQSLRRQLDGLQGKLAEAEARAAVAGTQLGSAAHDQTIGDLKSQIDKAMLRMRAAEEKSSDLQQQLTTVKTEARATTGSGATHMPAGAYDEDAEERVRLAEAKATKALAAARAAAAGLTVSNADIEAIESGLSVATEAPKRQASPMIWVAVAALAVAATVVVLFLSGALGGRTTVVQQAAPMPAAAAAAPTAAPVAPVAAGTPAAAAVSPVTPTVTPIDDPTPAAAATPTPAVAATPAPTPAPNPTVAAPAGVTPEAAPVVTPTPTTPVAVVAKPAPAKADPTPAKATPASRPAKVKASAKPGAIADPFAEPVKKKPAKQKIVDPF